VNAITLFENQEEDDSIAKPLANMLEALNLLRGLMG